ncbi:MAG: fatty acid desaturase [Pirellulales bacterium]
MDGIKMQSVDAKVDKAAVLSSVMSCMVFIPGLTLPAGWLALHMQIGNPFAVSAAATVSFYLLAMTCHDSIHGVAFSNGALNRAVGEISANLLGGSWAIFKEGHLRHHRNVGVSGEDPEQWVQNKALLVLLARLLAVNFGYYGWCRRRGLVALSASVQVIISLSLILIDYKAFLFGFLLPRQIACAFFAINTSVLPHSRLASFIEKTAPIVTGFHHTHHRAPKHPWYWYYFCSPSVTSQQGECQGGECNEA